MGRPLGHYGGSCDGYVYPYLLRGLEIDRPNQVWCTDITYIPMRRGFAYLVVIMDWHSRAILAWRLSSTLDTGFCLDALRAAAKTAGGWPEILSTDQGCQFTSRAWIDLAESNDVRVSMDGRRRWIDNVMVERFWRSLKYEDVYLREYQDLVELEGGLAAWIDFYNNERPHQALANATPWSIWAAPMSGLAAWNLRGGGRRRPTASSAPPLGSHQLTDQVPLTASLT